MNTIESIIVRIRAIETTRELIASLQLTDNARRGMQEMLKQEAAIVLAELTAHYQSK